MARCPLARRSIAARRGRRAAAIGAADLARRGGRRGGARAARRDLPQRRPRARDRHHRRARQRQDRRWSRALAQRAARARQDGRHRRRRPVEPVLRRRDPRRPHPHAASSRSTPASSSARMATRGALGGWRARRSTRSTCSTPRGYDIIIIETVGVGQDEVEVVQRRAHDASSCPCPASATTSRRSRPASWRSPTSTSCQQGRPAATPTARSPTCATMLTLASARAGGRMGACRCSATSAVDGARASTSWSTRSHAPPRSGSQTRSELAGAERAIAAVPRCARRAENLLLERFGAARAGAPSSRARRRRGAAGPIPAPPATRRCSPPSLRRRSRTMSTSARRPLMPEALTPHRERARRLGGQRARRVPEEAGRAQARVPHRSATSRSSASTRRPTSPTRRSRTSACPAAIPSRAGPIPTMYRGRLVDDAADRGLRHRRGHQRALPVPDRAGPDRALGRLRHADADGLRLRRSDERSARSAARASRSTRSTTWRRCSTASTSRRSPSR